MRIGIDNITAGQGFGASAGGMVVYIPNLLRAFLEVDATDEYVLFTNRDLIEFFPFENDRLTKVICPAVPLSRLQRVLYEQTVYPALIRHYDIDAFLGTCNVLPLFKSCPAVVVLQSLQVSTLVSAALFAES
jgi:hypothetical protein